MPPLLIRPLAPHEVPALAALRLKHEEGGASAERMSLYLAGEYNPQMALAPRAMWAADADGAPIAFIAGHLTRRLGCDGEVQWLYVIAARRRTRVASELLGRLAIWFAASGAHRVCVNASDLTARQFYGRHGATPLDAQWMVWADMCRSVCAAAGT